MAYREREKEKMKLRKNVKTLLEVDCGIETLDLLKRQTEIAHCQT